MEEPLDDQFSKRRNIQIEKPKEFGSGAGGEGPSVLGLFYKILLVMTLIFLAALFAVFIISDPFSRMF